MRPLIVAFVACLLTVAPAAALPPAPVLLDADTVTLVVNADAKLLSLHQPFHWEATIDWADVAALNATGTPNALDLLASVVAAEQSTYTASWFDLDGDGSLETAFIDEVNGVASDFTLVLVGYFWALYENGESASVGINQIPLEPGQTVTLDYTGFPVDA